MEFSVFEQNGVLDELVHIFDLLFSTERTLQNVPIWHLNAYFCTSVVRLLLELLELGSLAIPELALLLLIGKESQRSSSLILLSDVDTLHELGIIRADQGASTSGSSSSCSINHGSSSCC